MGGVEGVGEGGGEEGGGQQQKVVRPKISK